MNDRKAQHILRMVLYSGGAAFFGYVFVKLALYMLLANAEAISMGAFNIGSFIFTTIKLTLMGVVLGLVIGFFTKPPEDGDEERAKQSANDTLAKLGLPQGKAQSKTEPKAPESPDNPPVGDAAAATLEKLGIPNDGQTPKGD